MMHGTKKIVFEMMLVQSITMITGEIRVNESLNVIKVSQNLSFQFRGQVFGFLQIYLPYKGLPRKIIK